MRIDPSKDGILLPLKIVLPFSLMTLPFIWINGDRDAENIIKKKFIALHPKKL